MIGMPEDIYTLHLFQNGQESTSGGGSSKEGFSHTYHDIISLENLLLAWKEFVRGKKNKADVQHFQLKLIEHIIELHEDLKKNKYRHGSYYAFNISDPKPRNIHKATVRDRLLHHALYRILYPYFDTRFIFDSYSCRDGKGTHKAMNRFRGFFYKVSKNNTHTAWVLKCDIRKFFASIDHPVLLEVLHKHIGDENTLWLLERVIGSFDSGTEGKGLPLGNLTSQLLVNIYMNEFDQFVKHVLKMKYYIRYADDFVILSENKLELEELIPKIQEFLQTKLKLTLHPDKLFIKTCSSGIDFLGWVHFPNHRVIRTVTKRRMFKKLSMSASEQTIASYVGLLQHGNAHKIQSQVRRLML
jgi:RNA-directed DNA polymerase